MNARIKMPLLLLVILITSGYRTDTGSNLFVNDPFSSASNNDFTLVRCEEDISLYTRWIKVNEAYLTRQVKADFVIDCKAGSVVSILRSEETYLSWMKATESFYRLKTIDTNQWYSYVKFSIPWPLNDQDCILRYEIREHQELRQTEIIVMSEADFLKPNKGIERISHMEGRWVITQLESARTRVEYYVHSVQKPKYPTWMTDPLVQKNLIRSMDGLRDLAMKKSTPK